MQVKIVEDYFESLYIPYRVPDEWILEPLLVLISINDLPNDIKLEIEWLFDDVKLIVRPSSKEIRWMDWNKLSHCKDNWKLKFNTGKYKVLNIGFDNIKV